MMALGYVYGHDEAVSRFVASLIPHCRRGFGPHIKTMGVVEGGLLIAGIVYYNWDPEAGIIEIAGAALPGHFWLDAYPRHDWLMTAVEKRLREELAALQVEVNEEKSRIRGSGDQLDQPDPTWLGELLRGWARQRVLWLHSRLGGKRS